MTSTVRISGSITIDGVWTSFDLTQTDTTGVSVRQGDGDRETLAHRVDLVDGFEEVLEQWLMEQKDS